MARSRQVGELIRPTIRGTQIVEDPVGTEVAPTSVSTFEHVGIYWVPDNEGPSVDASVQFRVLGSGTWLPGYPLWYDARVPEYRGIIRGLAENTTYELKLTLSTGPFNVSEFTTWNDDPHITSTVQIPCGTDGAPRTTGFSTTAAGSATGGPGGVETYVKYVPTVLAENVIDCPGSTNGIFAGHSYVILEGFNIKNPAEMGVRLATNVHHVRIQGVSGDPTLAFDVSGWGVENTDAAFKGFGRDLDGAVYANQSTPINQVVIQRFRFHDPRWPANSWNGAPLGAVTVSIASPAVVSKTAHGRDADDPIYFRTTGALPTGITAGTLYYVLATGLTEDAFQFSASVGGAAINTSGSQSGAHAITGAGALHPEGAQPIMLASTSAVTGNNVIRDGEIYSTNGNLFNDCMGGSPNFSLAGFPGKDSFIGRVKCEDYMDDAIEGEGNGSNVLVEGNYMNEGYTGAASCIVGKGPIYFHRNIFDVSRIDPRLDSDASNCLPLSSLGVRGPFGKLGDKDLEVVPGHGRRYFTHNTVLQRSLAGKTRRLGANVGPDTSGGPMTQTVSRNNIWRMRLSTDNSIRDHLDAVPPEESATNSFDYEIRNGPIVSEPGTVIGTNLIDTQQTPIYAAGHGDDSDVSGADSGLYQLDPSSPGYGTAEPIPNFNIGAGADVGAGQHGDPAMQFGVPA